MRIVALGAGLLLAACTDVRAPDVTVADAWVRSASPGKAATAAYLTIENKGGADRLVAVSTPVGQASIHSTSMDSGVMRMRAVQSLDIGADAVVEMKPGGLHIMVTGLREPLTEGAAVPLRLQFARSGERQAVAVVRSSPPQERQ